MSVAALINTETTELAKCRPDQTLFEAVKTMTDRSINALAVIEKNYRLSGILTDHDVMRALAARDGQLEGEIVSGWMTHNVISCSPDTKLTEAVRLMGRHRIRHLVVIDSYKPVAVLGIREVLAELHQQDELEIGVLRDVAVASRLSAKA